MFEVKEGLVTLTPEAATKVISSLVDSKNLDDAILEFSAQLNEAKNQAEVQRQVELAKAAVPEEVLQLRARVKELESLQQKGQLRTQLEALSPLRIRPDSIDTIMEMDLEQIEFAAKFVEQYCVDAIATEKETTEVELSEKKVTNPKWLGGFDPDELIKL